MSEQMNRVIDLVTLAMAELAQVKRDEPANVTVAISHQKLRSARQHLIAKYKPITGLEHQGL